MSDRLLGGAITLYVVGVVLLSFGIVWAVPFLLFGVVALICGGVLHTKWIASKEDEVDDYEEAQPDIAATQGEYTESNTFTPSVNQVVYGNQSTQQVTAQEALLCAQCGNAIPANSKFCNNCASPVPEPKQESEDYRRGFAEGQKYAMSLIQQRSVKANSGRNLPSQSKKYCQKCGQVNDPSAPYCAGCGSVSFSSRVPTKISRPTVVTVIGAIQILISLVYIALGLLLGALLSTYLPNLGTIIMVVSFLPLIFALSLFSGRNWARVLMMIGAVFDLFAFPLGTALGIIILYYFTRPRVVAYFKQRK